MATSDADPAGQPAAPAQPMNDPPPPNQDSQPHALQPPTPSNSAPSAAPSSAGNLFADVPFPDVPFPTLPFNELYATDSDSDPNPDPDPDPNPAPRADATASCVGLTSVLVSHDKYSQGRGLRGPSRAVLPRRPELLVLHLGSDRVKSRSKKHQYTARQGAPLLSAFVEAVRAADPPLVARVGLVDLSFSSITCDDLPVVRELLTLLPKWKVLRLDCTALTDDRYACDKLAVFLHNLGSREHYVSLLNTAISERPDVVQRLQSNLTVYNPKPI